jgi:hypothetical protein
LGGAQAGLVGAGGEVVGEVTQVVLDLPEGAALGEVQESLGHLAEGLLGVGAQLAEEGLEACFAVVSGPGRGRGGGIQHGDRPGVTARKGYGFPAGLPDYQKAGDFAPTFLNHTHRGPSPPFFLDTRWARPENAPGEAGSPVARGVPPFRPGG